FTGLIGVSLFLSLYINFFEPLINTIVLNSPRKLETLDVGWEVLKKVIFDSPLILHILISAVLVNILMLLFKLTRTLNIDFWNYWNFILVGSVVFAITKIQWLGVFTSLVIVVITLVLSDIYAPYIEKYSGIKGISTPQANIICWAPVSHIVNLIFNKIPFIGKIKIYFEKIHYKMGIVSQPMIMGFILGFIIGAISKYQNFTLALKTNLLFSFSSGLKLSIIMALLPRMLNILIKGLASIVSDIRNFTNRKYPKRIMYIGIDPLIFAGYPSVIFLSTIIIPLSVLIATRLPGNTILPRADLIIIPLIVLWVIVPSEGDMIRSFISGIVIIPVLLLVAGDMADFFTELFRNSGLEVVKGYQKISSMGAGSNVFFWLLLKILEPFLKLF
ncbi:MAG: hypothetical protein H5T85_00300, partial [Actinobacteria bacterium]|nr:hypothetical protein [Actinomycetota bacterium]